MTDKGLRHIMVSVDTKRRCYPLSEIRIESELEVKSYLHDLKYALEHGAKVSFQEVRLVDQDRDVRYTNQFTPKFRS